MNNDRHVLDLLPAYGIGALEDEERLKVTEHLKGCQLCQKELAAYQESIDRIPLSVPIYKPPPRVKKAIFSKLSTEKGNRSALFNNLRNRLVRPAPGWIMIGLSVLVVLLLAGTGVLWWQTQQLVQNQHDQFTVITLNGRGTNGTANGWIVVSENGQSGTLIVQNLPQIDKDQSYQLWMYKDNQAASGGVFWVDADGYASIWVSAPFPLIDYKKFVIDVEPYKGSDSPTGSTVISGQVQ